MPVAYVSPTVPGLNSTTHHNHPAATKLPSRFSPEAWMAGQAECPTCRAKFCMHDILAVGAATEDGSWVNVDTAKQD